MFKNFNLISEKTTDKNMTNSSNNPKQLLPLLERIDDGFILDHGILGQPIRVYAQAESDATAEMDEQQLKFA
jgi:hypothetical protein